MKNLFFMLVQYSLWSFEAQNVQSVFLASIQQLVIAQILRYLSSRQWKEGKRWFTDESVQKSNNLALRQERSIGLAKEFLF